MCDGNTFSLIQQVHKIQ